MGWRRGDEQLQQPGAAGVSGTGEDRPGAGGLSLGQAEARERETAVLRAMIDSARDAIWCIDFLEPVDLEAPEPEIIRQVFENDCCWRFCNGAMARLYGLPDGLDFNQQAVSAYFPRSEANETMVRQLIAHGFRLDNAPAIDQRHDGSEMHVENDVRSQIRDGKLVRMWGTVRDVSAERLRERELNRRMNDMLEVLSAAPDPILVLDEQGTVLAANPAVERDWGWRTSDVLSGTLADLLGGEDPVPEALRALERGAARFACSGALRQPDGGRLPLALHFSEMADGPSGRRLVMTGRSAGDAPGLCDSSEEAGR